MSFGSALYRLLIGPLELLFETVFAVADRLVGNHGVAIVFLSLAMNFLVLPLYRRADAMQEEQRDATERLRPGVEHIKKTFKGDERFMMLQTYYRQNHYKQTDALKGSVSLLLEIPFFIAAYRFLSGLQLLQGVAFGPIRDLGAPDGLLALGGVTINVLPILMTVINLISAEIYMKGFPFKSKIQMYVMALLFLVLLYTSPAGLVFYWTLNNVFSLLKNVFYKLRRPGLVLGALFSLVGVAGAVVLCLAHPASSARRQAFLLLGCAALQLPLAWALWKRRRGAPPAAVQPPDGKLFWLSAAALTVLTGLLIPSAVIKSSPAEFVNLLDMVSPLQYVWAALLSAAGTFLIWFGIFYKLADARGKRLFGCAMAALAAAALVDYLFFGTDYGNLSSLLKYDTLPVATLSETAVNLAALCAVAAAVLLLWRKRPGALRLLVATLCLATAGMSAVNAVSIRQDYAALQTQAATSDEVAHFTLSKTGKNVVVLMMDRAIASFVPYLMQEKPELQEMLAGFTYYPNTLSYGSSTNFGTPGIYGGYEYIPEQMNARADQTLAEKQNEALKVLPVLFDNAGYDVTVCDPTYAGYSWVPDLSIYDDYPDIHAYITMNGSYSADAKMQAQAEKVRKRNFFCYSLFRAAPLALQGTLYNRGNFNYADTAEETAVATTQTEDGVSRATGLSRDFMNPYSVLCNLSRLTQITDSDENTFLMMSNDTTHQPVLLQEPDYTPAAEVDNTEYDAAHAVRSAEGQRSLTLDNTFKMEHYQVNMAALLKLGAWFDYLRENDVFDNTRIIIVSDHGANLGIYPETVSYHEIDGESKVYDMLSLQSLLLVKDFGSDSFQVSEEFMTNADTPTLATAGLLENPVNPFTGNAISSAQKDAPEQHALFSYDWQITENNGNTFLPGAWFAVHDDVRVAENWSYLGVH